MRLDDFQQRFQAAILDPNTRVTDADLGMKTRPGAAPQQRLSVHHNHFWTRIPTFVRVSARELSRYLGAKEFGELVKAYILMHPPSETGKDVAARLPEFLAMRAPWRDSPVLAHLAHYDRHWAIAAAGAEEIAIAPADLAQLEPETYVRLNKRAIVVETRYRFHQLELAKLPRDTLPDREPTFLLLHKRTPRDRIRMLGHGEHLALSLLARGITIRDLTMLPRERGREATQIERWMVGWAHSELLVAIDQGDLT